MHCHKINPVKVTLCVSEDKWYVQCANILDQVYLILSKWLFQQNCSIGK